MKDFTSQLIPFVFCLSTNWLCIGLISDNSQIFELFLLAVAVFDPLKPTVCLISYYVMCLMSKTTRNETTCFHVNVEKGSFRLDEMPFFWVRTMLIKLRNHCFTIKNLQDEQVCHYWVQNYLIVNIRDIWNEVSTGRRNTQAEWISFREDKKSFWLNLLKLRRKTRIFYLIFYFNSCFK